MSLGVDDSRTRLARVAALAMLAAGLLHLAIVRDHWSHAPAHAAFFLVAGLFQVIWAIAFWRTASQPLTKVGFVVALLLVLLWAVTRVLPAPFGHGPEETDIAGVVTKVCEIACIGALAIVLVTAFADRQGAPAWRSVATLVLVAIVATAGVYGLAVAAEPFLPSLAAPTEASPDHNHEEHPHSLFPVALHLV